MKTTFKIFVMALAIGLFTFPATAQEILTNFRSTTEQAPVRRSVAEARFLPFFDDFSQSILYPDSTKWTDNNVMVNDGFPLCPPNRNGATFDVLDANGRVYNYAISNPFVSEYLTSVRIRLDSIMEPTPRALTPADSVYLSLYYQPQGNGNAPEEQDSLVLQFGLTTERQEFLFLDYQTYSIDDIFAELQVDTLFPGDTIWASVGCQPGMFTIVTDTITQDMLGSISVPCDSVFTTVADTTWYHIWSAPGQKLETFMAENGGKHFKQVMIPINDLKYFKDNFYFRFYNYASIVNNSLPANRSNEDNWSIDFVYLNYNRSMDDTHYPMVTFTGQKPSFFNRYQSIPYRQYRNNPTTALRESLSVDIANLDDVEHEINYYYKVDQIAGSQHYTHVLDPVTVQPYSENGYLECPEYGESPACPYVGELFALNMWIDSASYQISHYLYDSTANPPLADLGYGVSNAGGMFAVRFDISDYDTIQGVQLLFNHTLNDANDKYFDIMVWKDENGKPGDTIFTMKGQRPQWQEQPYRFTYYKFNRPVTTANSFYIGIQQSSNGLINIGFDTSIDNMGYNFVNTNGAWQPSNMPGSLMIRPVVGASYYIGVEENSSASDSETLTVYPNPASDMLHLEGDFENGQVSLFDLTGRIVYQGVYQHDIAVSNLNNGMYFIQVVTAEGQVINQKFIISK